MWSASPEKNLREVALREGVELYGLKGKLGNCGRLRQCITCFVRWPRASTALSARTAVEDASSRTSSRLGAAAVQALVEHSVVVLTVAAGACDGQAQLGSGPGAPLPAGPHRVAGAAETAEQQSATTDEDKPRRADGR